MRTTNRIAAVVIAVALLAVVPTLASQEQQPAPRAPQAQTSVTGDLVKVDAEAKLLIIKAADGGELEFKYDDKTEILGAKEGAAGLATMKEGRVTVHFKEDADTKARTATKIEILPKQ